MDGLQLLHMIEENTSPIMDVSWSYDGTYIGCSTVFDGVLYIWDTKNWNKAIVTVPRGKISRFRWSCNNIIAASGSSVDEDELSLIWLLDPNSGNIVATYYHDDLVTSLCWSPDGDYLASSGYDKSLKIYNLADKKIIFSKITQDEISSLVWLPKSSHICIGYSTGRIDIINIFTGSTQYSLSGNKSKITSMTCDNSERTLMSSSDTVIQVWDIEKKVTTHILEGHTGITKGLCLNSDGRLLASKSMDGTIKLWRTDTWELVSTLKEPVSNYLPPNISFHPSLYNVLATLGNEDKSLRIWKIDYSIIFNQQIHQESIRYANAKIVLLGDRAVGKSGLALALTGNKWEPTESTHGRKVFLFDEHIAKLDDWREEKREILLWDLAGQPGYRLIHQLHLSEVSTALIVFDAESEKDPFAGVRYWDKALLQAMRVSGKNPESVRKFLVAAKVDRGGISVSRERLERFMHEYNFSGYYETSAKENWGITDLWLAANSSLDWETIIKVSSTSLFQRIRDFLLTEVQNGRILSSLDDLFSAFLNSKFIPDQLFNVKPEFETVLGRVESRGIVRKLSFGNLVLLQPELMDAYASSIVMAAKEEPDGMGCIAEEDVKSCRFKMPSDERLEDKELERLLLIATIEDLLRYEIALREPADEGIQLVFPSQFTRENPEYPKPKNTFITFTFEGAVTSIYATLAVRLSHSGVFRKKEMWRNAATYSAGSAIYGIFLQELEEGIGQLTLFYGNDFIQDTQDIFEKYVLNHLEKRAIGGSIKTERTYICSTCKTHMVHDHIVKRLARNKNYIICPVCDEHIKIDSIATETKSIAIVTQIERSVDEQIKLDVAKSIAEAKMTINEFDVFLCHNSRDKVAVKEIAHNLRAKGIVPWLDEEQLRPGFPWQRLLEQQIVNIKSAAVFVGQDGIGPWQTLEMEAFLREFVKRGCPIIPVLLDYAPKEPDLPIFLSGMTWVDFRKIDNDPLSRLIWGITGHR